MRVIKHGHQQSEHVQKCSNCDCEYAFFWKELKTKVEYDFEIHKGYAYEYIECPECGCKWIRQRIELTNMPE